MSESPSMQDSRETLSPGDLREVTIEKIVNGGDGLSHIGTQAVFVPFSAPGDVLEVRITEVARNFVRAEISRILTESPMRRTPPCQYFGRCGGCQLQHLDYPSQLTVKASFLRESLKRVGRIDWPHEIEIRSGVEFGYRSRAEIKLARNGEGKTSLGFFRYGTHEVCGIDECRVLLPSLNLELRNFIDNPTQIPSDATRIYLTAGDDGVITTPATGENQRAAEYDAVGTAHQHVNGIDYSFGVRSFFQGNRYLLEELVKSAIGDARGSRAVDLYAGVGLFSLQLARCFEEVYAVEGNRIAASHGMENVRLNEVSNVRYDAISVEAWLKYKAAGLESPDFLILDPPRAGAGNQVIDRIVQLRPARVSYVSCDPATLARDLRMFLDKGYEMRSVVALDMFPQTFHVESVVHLEASNKD